jgi:hypothetical protein
MGMTSKVAKYLLAVNLVLAVALVIFCVPLDGVFKHVQARLISTLRQVDDSHIDLVQSLLKAIHTDVMVSTRVALGVSACLLVNAAVCFLGIRQSRKHNGG